MDEIIKRYGYTKADLLIMPYVGVAYQRDMKITASYDRDYFLKYEGYSGSQVAEEINKARRFFVDKYHTGSVLDVGIGNGEFIKTRPGTYGYDVNEHAVNWLKSNKLYSECFGDFRAFTFWDVIEHVPEPISYFQRIKPGDYLFTSIPIIQNINDVLTWKHYKPGEHLYYFERGGFVSWMLRHKFSMVECNACETEAGRDDIVSFAFIKNSD